MLQALGKHCISLLGCLFASHGDAPKKYPHCPSAKHNHKHKYKVQAPPACIGPHGVKPATPYQPMFVSSHGETVGSGINGFFFKSQLLSFFDIQDKLTFKTMLVDNVNEAHILACVLLSQSNLKKV